MRHPFPRRQCCLVCLAALTAASYGAAAPSLIKKVDQRGDFVLFGNTLGWDCDVTASTTYMPSSYLTAVNNLCATRTTTDDSAIDIYWSDNDGSPLAVAVTSNMANARSTAVLNLPSGAVITYARLYWGAYQPGPNAVADSTVTIERPGNANVRSVTADKTWTALTGVNTDIWYQGAADITDWVSTMGSGAFRVKGVTAINNVLTYDSNNVMAGWYMVVFYQRAADPPRNLAIFEGLDTINVGGTQTVTIDGFLVPGTFDAKLGAVAFEGDADTNGDAMSMGPNDANLAVVSNTRNPANNFFNSSRTYLDALVSNTGDIPQLTGAAGSMGGLDMDVIDVKSLMTAGQTSATIRASSSNERFALAAFITSISTFKPDFSSSGKTVTDKDGAPLRPGDTLVYEVVATNSGSDTSTNTVLKDKLPSQVSYVPGTLVRVTTGGNVAITDAPNDDVGEYDGTTGTITVRLGTGANATTGGTMAVGDSITLRFEVTLKPNATGLIENQAIITAAGVQGAPASDYPTDGNGSTAGAPPTQIGVDTDGDGLPDVTETATGTNPNDADSDDDGVQDGAEPSYNLDTDGDGLINALDPDSDNDGLFDGTELGLGCGGAGTASGSPTCRADADSGATKTDPLLADTDGGGVRDGSEDVNLNGKVEPGETNPITGSGGDDGSNVDSDGDGLSNGLEATLGSNPNDKDSDDDGVLDGLEPNPSEDGDLDGLVDVMDPDSDNDGLFDGTEMGYDCSNAATAAATHACIADADPATHTSPLMADTDGGGVIDGSEDWNHNGKLDRDGSNNPLETDPNVRADDTNALNLDTDGDGLSDKTEGVLGSNPNDKDSDDDGVPDGTEPNPSADTDGDTSPNIKDPDSDGDGLFDGTELGYGCTGQGTATGSTTCIADADTATKTSMLDPDTDNGGMSDGQEDTNKNGKAEANERNPNVATDDTWACVLDTDCNASITSGRVCDTNHVCINGCHAGGNGCPSGQVCSSTTTTIGTCSTPQTGTGGAAGAAGAAGAPAAGGVAATTTAPSIGGATMGGTTATVAATGGVVTFAGTSAVATTSAGTKAVATGGTVSSAGTSAVATGGTTTSGTVAAAGTAAQVTGGATAAGGQTTSSGTVVATGGSTIQSATGTGGKAGGVEGEDAALEGGGCDCTVAGKNENSNGWLLAMVAGLLWLRRRRSQ